MVLQESPDDGTHPDIVRQAGDTRPQRADTAHDQVNLHAGAGCRVERLDDFRFQQRVHFCNDARGLAGLGIAALAIDGSDDVRVQREGRHPQVMEFLRAPQAGQLLEGFADIVAYGFIAGEQPEIGIQPGCAGMVIARGHMHVAAQSAKFPANHHQHLGMGLESDHAIHHVGADLFQFGCPVEIGFLIKAGQQFHHDGDFLAALRCIDEVFHQHRIRSGAIDRLLDCHHIGVFGSLFQELDDRTEGLIRMVQQDVAILYGGKHIRRFFQRARQPWHEGGEFERCHVDQIGDLHQAHQIHRSVDPVQVGLREFELFQQEVFHFRRAADGDFEADGVAKVPLRQFTLQRRAQVRDFLVIQEQVAVARHAKRIGAQHVHALKQRADKGLQHVGQQHEAMVASGDLFG